MGTLTPRRLAVLAAAMIAIPFVNSPPADASVSAGVSAGRLIITGDGFSDQVALRLNPADATTLDIDFDDDGAIDGSFPRGSFTQVGINMGGGADSVRIDDSAGVFTNTETTEMFGGEGNDTLTGGGGVELLAGGGGEDTIAGGVEPDFADGGTGDDTFLWGVTDGDDTVTDEDGADRVLVDGSDVAEQFVIDRFPAPHNDEVRVSRVAQGRVVEASALGLQDVERLDLDTVGGNDSIAASPDVGGLIALDIDAGADGSISESIGDDDVVTASDAADVIAGGPGADRLDGRGGNDAMNGGDDGDMLIGGPGSDAMTGGGGADEFQCEGPGEVLDAQPEDLVPAFCVSSPPVVEPAPAPVADTGAPAPAVTGLPTGFLGFGKPVVRATREGLRVKLTNVHFAPIAVKVAASERFKSATRARTARYKAVRTTIAVGARRTLRLRAPRALRAHIAARLTRTGRVVRRPTATVTNVATAGKRTVLPRLVLSVRSP
jgi:RTX calcium-binding nonapeptide repeat (4 copies)